MSVLLAVLVVGVATFVVGVVLLMGKVGHHWWEGLIPGYNLYVLFRAARCEVLLALYLVDAAFVVGFFLQSDPALQELVWWPVLFGAVMVQWLGLCLAQRMRVPWILQLLAFIAPSFAFCLIGILPVRLDPRRYPWAVRPFLHIEHLIWSHPWEYDRHARARRRARRRATGPFEDERFPEGIALDGGLNDEDAHYGPERYVEGTSGWGDFRDDLFPEDRDLAAWPSRDGFSEGEELYGTLAGEGGFDGVGFGSEPPAIHRPPAASGDGNPDDDLQSAGWTAEWSPWRQWHEEEADWEAMAANAPARPAPDPAPAEPAPASALREPDPEQMYARPETGPEPTLPVEVPRNGNSGGEDRTGGAAMRAYEPEEPEESEEPDTAPVDPEGNLGTTGAEAVPEEDRFEDDPIYRGHGFDPEGDESVEEADRKEPGRFSEHIERILDEEAALFDRRPGAAVRRGRPDDDLSDLVEGQIEGIYAEQIGHPEVTQAVDAEEAAYLEENAAYARERVLDETHDEPDAEGYAARHLASAVQRVEAEERDDPDWPEPAPKPERGAHARRRAKAKVPGASGPSSDPDSGRRAHGRPEAGSGRRAVSDLIDRRLPDVDE